MKLGSLFDGEGGFPLSGVMCGIEPVFASEIEPFPIAVTRSRFPQMKHLGDVSAVNGADIDPVDIITFGSPCQDMSVAGKRNGLKHEDQGDDETTRSGLFFEAIRIIKEMRLSTNGTSPRYAVWENVPGAFSSNRGYDFLAVLQAFASVREPSVSIPEPARSGKSDGLTWLRSGCIMGNGWSLAWRTLDAQYWGVPQRRNRIYLVADFSSECAREVLLESHRLRGNNSESEEARERVAEDAAGRADGSVGISYAFQLCGDRKDAGLSFSDKAYCVPVNPMSDRGQSVAYGKDAIGVQCLNPWDAQSMRVYADSGVHPSVNANSGGGQDRHAVLLSAGFSGKASAGAETVGFGDETSATIREGQETHCVIALQANGIDRADTAGCNGAGWREDQSYTLNTIDRHAVVYEPKSALEENWAESSVKNALRANASKSAHAVVYPEITGTIAASGAGTSRTAGQGNETDLVVVEPCKLASGKPSVGTLMANASTKQWLGNQEAFSGDYSILEPNGKKYIVRRLMPVECLRLQGYPDWWHDLAPFDGDVEFWEGVRKTYARIMGTRYTPMKDAASLERWYYRLRNDAAEYKADGNSLAIPCAAYVMKRISICAKAQEGAPDGTAK